MSEKPIAGAISRRKALSMFGLVGALGLAASAELTAPEACAQETPPGTAPSTGTTSTGGGTAGMQRRQQRRAGRHERRHERRTGQPAGATPAGAAPAGGAPAGAAQPQ
jgi:hypothetical protein